MPCLNKPYNKFENSAMMGPKMQNRCCTALAVLMVAVLLTIIIMVWVQVGHGVFKANRLYNVTVSDNDPYTTIENNIMRETTSESSITSDFTQNDGLEAITDVEYVNPMKISPLPLHDLDLMFDQLRNNHEHPPIRHHSGHFRHKSAEVWDPHPQYEIDAFGLKLILELAHNDKLISPDLHVTHVWENYTQRVRHDPKTANCYYSGFVKDDKSSHVVVSLCNGMTGYIKTNAGNYYIEPVEPAKELQDNLIGSMKHRITKIRPSEEDSARNDFEEEQCETKISDDNHVVHSIERRSVGSLDFDDYSAEFPYNVPVKNPDEIQSSTSQYFIETMVVADKKTAQYHKTEEDLINYILTLMSHVALLFKDATIGNPITLAVVDIMILKEKEFTSATSQDMLNKFCKFQNSYTKRQHDVALLLTRDVICKKSTLLYCNTLGIANVNSMCNPDSSCAIVRDKGLSTSYTIAHELGHTLSMPHDDDKMCYKFHGGIRSNNIMSKSLHNDTEPWHWSTCSKHYLTDFLDSPRSQCLLDVPKKDFIMTDYPLHLLPGETFEVNKQCELEFGTHSKICSYMVKPLCVSLWCSTDLGETGGCKTQGLPWAEGTTCGPGRWCHHGKCVDRKILSPIAGAWGPWQNWSACSRTCGGGIKISKRDCINPAPSNGGPYCVGGSTRYHSCNTQPCEPDVPDFREVQCNEYNGKTKGIAGLTPMVKWVPKYGTSSPDDYCKLYCRVQHSSAYYLLKEKVIDGTKCFLNSVDICVNGMCQKGGCDNKLSSNATLDECGVCGGDNSQCQVISGYHNTSTYGYNMVVRIPKGSSNIRITQKGIFNTEDDDNYLALRDAESGEYILNGKFVVATALKDVIYGGLTITYSGSHSVTEKVTTPRNSKLAKDLIVEVLSVGKVIPPDISYTYTIRRDEASRHVWGYYEDKYTICDSICGGMKHQVSYCKDEVQNKIVNASFCAGYQSTSAVPCNTHCKLIWVVSSTGACSEHCGQGTRQLSYNCMKHTESINKREIVDEKHCRKLPAPPRFEICMGACELTRWMYDDWGTCSKTCGGGLQYRTAKCVDSNLQEIDRNHCDAYNKITEQSCNTQKCPIWSYGEWTPCSVTCGIGYKTKPYFCHVDNQIYEPESCKISELSIVKEECVMDPCILIHPKWEAGNWSECTSNCGVGIQKREVKCMQNYDEVNEAYCFDLLKPNDTKECRQYKCVEKFNNYHYEENAIISNQGFKWKTGSWSECSKSCNGGFRTRLVTCRNERGDGHDFYCDDKARPINKTKCNDQACFKWEVGTWSKCDKNCQQSRQVYCQDSHGNIISLNKCDRNQKPETVGKCKKPACLKDLSLSLNNNNMFSEPNKRVYKWRANKWGPCSKSCGKGERRRVVSCVDVETDTKLVDVLCKNLTKPRTTRVCRRNNCKYVWMEGQWSQCSKSCGYGRKTREVTCHKVLPGGYTDPKPYEFRSEAPEDFCDFYNKPNTTSDCIESNCSDPYRWAIGPWGECSQTCGRRGRQIRRITCKSRQGVEVKRHFCRKLTKPKRKRKCNESKCLYESCKQVKQVLKTNENKDYTLSINGKLVVVYCYKMDTKEPEEFISLKPGKDNFAEVYHKRLKNSNTCPYGGDRRENCDCLSLEDGYGKTVFWKVRLNITSLEIITTDFTFSKTSSIHKGGSKVPYGTAGDCYSEVQNCAQGLFSVDLTDTSFRISRNVQWITSGNKPSKEITVTKLKVSGKCGGYCGNCFPDPMVGLKVEIT